MKNHFSIPPGRGLALVNAEGISNSRYQVDWWMDTLLSICECQSVQDKESLYIGGVDTMIGMKRKIGYQNVQRC